MEEENRPRRHSRFRRSCDLRRKVLLQNFLREQKSPRPFTDFARRPFANTETVLITHDSAEDEIIDVEEEDEFPSDESDSQNSTEMEVDKANPSMFDFAKLTKLKLSLFNYRKKKESPSLSPEAIKAIVDKNLVHLESKEKNKNAEAKNGHSLLKLKTINPWKRKPTIELEKKRGIKKTKDLLQSSKVSIKLKFDKNNHESKSKLSKVRKMIAAVNQAIKGDSPKVENMSVDDNKLDESGQMLPRHRNCSPDSSHLGSRSSKYGSFNSGILVDFENEENNERVKMFKEIEERLRKRRIPSDCFLPRSLVKHPNYRLARLLEDKTFRSRLKAELKKEDSCISWSLNEIRKLEKANKDLRKENKLLSENLSSIMADFGVAHAAGHQHSIYSPCRSTCNVFYGSKQDAYRKNVVTQACKVLRSRSVQDRGERRQEIKSRLSSQSMCHRENVESPLCKVLRSQSVQDRGERRREIKSRLSSRSMCHRPYSRFPPRTLYRAKPCIINPPLPEEVPLPYPDKPPTLPLLSDHDYSRPISYSRLF